MGEEVSLRSTSPPVANDYEKKDFSDYTRLGEGPDSVNPVSFRPVGDFTSIDHISGLVPTNVTTGYVNGGSSINFRPKHDEPIEDGGLLGVGDVDFDTKCTDAYANLDDVRDRHYHLTRGPRSLSPTERTIYKGVPNHHPKEERRKSFFLAGFMAVVFLLELFILALVIFNLVNGLQVGTFTKGLVSSASSTASTPQLSTQEVSATVALLVRQMNELQHNLTMYNSTHGTSLHSIASQILALSAVVNNFTTSTANLTTEAPSPKSVNISLYGSCTSLIYKCLVGNSVTTSSSTSLPDFSSCVTGSYTHTNISTYLANIRCSVTDGDQITPVSSTLTYDQSTNMWSCRCQAIIIPNGFFTELQNFNCVLNVTRCSKTIQIPLQ